MTTTTHLLTTAARHVRLNHRNNAPLKYCVRYAGKFSAPSPGSMPSGSPVQVGDVAGADYTKEEKRLVNHTMEESPYALGKHRSNALELVHRIPIVEVDGEMAICDGGGGTMGHPIEYISLERPGAVEYCKYCSIRYTQKKNH